MKTKDQIRKSGLRAYDWRIVSHLEILFHFRRTVIVIAIINGPGLL